MSAVLFPTKRSTGFALLLVFAGLVGWFASFQLLVEKIETLIDPTHIPSCNISPLVSCGPNMNSEQGSVLGFPNPILGVAGFMAPIVVGFALLAGARFARWFWGLFTLGMAAAFAFGCWLVVQSIYVLGTLCPYCMVVWLVTIPLFWYLLIATGAMGVWGRGAVKRVARSALPWTWLLAVLCYVVIAAMAQLRLDVIASLTYGL